ncbi:MAG: YfiR family protein [Acidobacteria bacterium]|nr:YfiR family protein [Acidobacteriota bacterium]
MTRIGRLLLGVLLCNVPAFSLTEQQAALERELKAVYVYNLAKYVEWPVQRLKPQSAIVIGVQGKDPFGGALAEAVRGRTAQDMQLLIRKVTSLQDAIGCHIVFFGSGPAAKMRALLDGLHTVPVLTVGDSEEFAKAGGMIVFVRDGEKVRFDIALTVVECAGLKIRTPLLRLARKVTPAAPANERKAAK